MKSLQIFVFLGSFSWVAVGGPWAVSSGTVQTPMVELYSSEGCSSCPPADRFFSSLRKRGDLWKGFTPVGFHVDYWDRLGWVDKLASRRFTRRQYAYAALWGAKNVYTPGLVFQGSEWKGWRNKKFPASPKAKPGRLTLEAQSGGKFKVEFETAQKGPWDMHVVVLGNGIQSKVQSGENAGKTLKHDFVVLAWGQAPSHRFSKKSVVATLKLRPTTKVKVPQNSVVAWVTPKGKLVPVQSVGGDLPSGLLR